ncbi:MAG TPA: N-acetylmuramoyl-L-alanine amidase [Thermoanaerobaculia bacterium]|jgi:N-acetylmuramoyl-L-alanine amidase|nr:N-acetylmuramoyl-L-alanine amidase [Thermoanaerobaculia bacterium]
MNGSGPHIQTLVSVGAATTSRRSLAAILATALFLQLPVPIAAASPASERPKIVISGSKPAPTSPPLPIARTLRVPLDDGAFVRLAEDQAIEIEATAKPGEGMIAFARRLCGDALAVDRIADSNGGRRELLSGMRYRVPLDLLTPEMRLRALRALFPEDRFEPDSWQHKVRGAGPLGRESLWHVATWFTGNGENFRAIRELNELPDDELSRGTTVAIPAELLLPALRSSLPKGDGGFRLNYGKDAYGDFAIYRLRPGEALYSAVVVRFTGRIHAQDVNALAAELAKRNGIPDVTDIPVGYRVKIPLDLLQPEFLPPGDPRRVAYEAELAESEKFTNPVRAQGLEGITVILDPGHGGKDAGASMGGVWESLYVYDIVMRTKRRLETRTAAHVLVTTRDGADFKIHDSDVLPFSRGHAVLTTPAYPIVDPVLGVNLRWYLANSIFRQITLGATSSKSTATASGTSKGNDEDKVVFLSVHADSLHPSLRGAMAYIPAASLGEDTYGKSGAAYSAFREVQENPYVRLPREWRTMSEGLSRQLAEKVIGAIAARKLPVHPFKPVREKVIRDQREWVPAVLRYNAVPAKLLLEVCNLGNDLDRSLIQTRAYREEIATAIVQGLLDYYGQSTPGGGSVQVAKSAK